MDEMLLDLLLPYALGTYLETRLARIEAAVARGDADERDLDTLDALRHEVDELATEMLGAKCTEVKDGPFN